MLGGAARAAVAPLLLLAGASAEASRRLRALAPDRGSGPAEPFSGDEWVSGVHFLYKVPPGDAKPSGLFLFLHACQRNATDFFDMPEESAMTSAALQRGYAVAAPDSAQVAHSGGAAGCWHTGLDGPIVTKALTQLREELELDQSPMYGVGLSSGGLMLVDLLRVWKVKFDGLHFNVAPHAPRTTYAAPGPHSAFATGDWPRTSFVHMEKDLLVPTSAIRLMADALRERGVRVQDIEIAPRPIDELPTVAGAVGVPAETLRQASELIKTWGYTDPTRKEKQKYIMPLQAATVSQRLLASSISGVISGHARALAEELSVFEGLHAPTAQRFNEVLDFLLAK